MSKRPSDKITANDFGLLRAYLAKNKVSQAEINKAIGTAAAGRTRGEIAQALRIWLRARPAA
jgi:hypothetical protein